MVNTEIINLNNDKIFELTLCRAKDNMSTELDGETVILDVTSGVYSGLDSTGTFIWNQLEHPATIGSLRDDILKRYDVTEGQCLVDLIAFIKNLADHGLISIRDE